MHTIHLDDDAYRYLRSAVGLHRAQLSGGFMTSLGDRFLLAVFRNIARSKYGIALVATTGPLGGEVVDGFLLGTTNTARLYRDFVVWHGAEAAVIAAPKLLRLSSIRMVWETFRYPAKRNALNAPAAELLDLAVSDSAKGTGLARDLFRAFAIEVERRGHSSFRITTGESLVRAHRFYEKQGAVPVGTIEIHKGESTLVFVYRAGSNFNSTADVAR
jgi:GNAT superfamily N-acetyltransferase